MNTRRKKTYFIENSQKMLNLLHIASYTINGQFMLKKTNMSKYNSIIKYDPKKQFLNEGKKSHYNKY